MTLRVRFALTRLEVFLCFAEERSLLRLPNFLVLIPPLAFESTSRRDIVDVFRWLRPVVCCSFARSNCKRLSGLEISNCLCTESVLFDLAGEARTVRRDRVEVASLVALLEDAFLLGFEFLDTLPEIVVLLFLDGIETRHDYLS